LCVQTSQNGNVSRICFQYVSINYKLNQVSEYNHGDKLKS